MEKSSETQGDESIRKHLRQELLNELPRLGLGSAALLISSISNQAFPRAMGRLIDNDYSWKIGMIVLGGGLASLVRTYSLQTAEARIGQRLSDAAVSHLLRYKDLEWFRQSEQESDPVVLASSILHDDVPKIAKTLTVTVANMVRSTSAVVLSSVNMLLVSPSLLGVAASVVPLVGAAGMFLRKTIRKMSEADSTLSDTTSSFLQERLRHIAMVRQYDRSNDEFAAYLKFQQQRLDLLENNSLREGLFMGFLFSATASALMLVVWMGGKAVARGRMTGGQLTSFSTYAFLLGIGTSGLVKAYSEGAAGLVAAERYYSLLADQDDEGRTSKEMLQKEDTRKQMDKPQNVQTMEIRDLHFSYKGSSRSCLNGLSFELRRGEVVALVGANGTGKTTVASLLCGLLAPTNGSILVDDPSSKAKVDLSDLNSTSKQRIVQMIPQSAALFDISIVENVQYGNPKASLLDIRYALSKAKCNDFISRLPEGLDSKVGIDGVKLSGGQRQRLALARALLADPPILIMDEPATALDAEGFGVIAETVSSGRGRAMLLITHSAKTLEMAHRILVLDEGKIVEKGTFRELRENKKSKLCELMPSLAGMQ